jgi:NADPH:quinone reductase-like Zn-dependent oxidoreductase
MRAFGLADDNATAGVFDLPVPTPGPGEVRVQVQASSVNGYDTFVAGGMARAMLEHRYPVVAGKDFSGVVDAVGEGVQDVAVGQDVTGITPPSMAVDSVGSYAEFVVVPSSGFTVGKPASVDHEHAACVGLAALTGLVSVNAVSPSTGQTVLVVGATGGVGTYAVQLATARGANVIATALADDVDWIRDLGASETADYSGDVPGAVRSAHPEGIDALIVAVHVGEGYGPLADLVRDGGAIASTVGGPDDVGRGVSVTNVFGQSDPTAFAEVMRLSAEGALAVPITKTYGFDDLPEALGLVGKRASRGKVAIRIA